MPPHAHTAGRLLRILQTRHTPCYRACEEIFDAARSAFALHDIMHSDTNPPADAYVVVNYGATAYWVERNGVERNDFDPKYAFTVAQNLMALAQADTSSKAPVVTMPAN
jgi:hypothetical protein